MIDTDTLRVLISVFAGLCLLALLWGLIVKVTVRWVVNDLRALGVLPAVQQPHDGD